MQQRLESVFAGALPPIDFAFAMGALSVAITLLAYAVLLRQIIWGTKRPSPIAWIGFGLCTGVGYLVQFYAGVRAGSWTMGVTAFFCFIVGSASILKGGRKTQFLDWVALALGLVTFAGWLACYLYKLNQTLAAVLATASDLLLYIPLIRAGWSQPELDSRMAYFLNTIKFVPALIVTVPFTVATTLYPIALIIANSSMNIMLGLRQWRLAENMQMRWTLPSGLASTAMGTFVVGVAIMFAFLPEVGRLSSTTLSGYITLAQIHRGAMAGFMLGWAFILLSPFLYAAASDDPLRVERWPSH